jgi:hypothetical protein
MTEPARRQASSLLTRPLARIFGARAMRDDLPSRLIGAVLGAGIVVAVAWALAERMQLFPRSFLLLYAGIVAVVALVPQRRFTLGQTTAVVGTYVALRCFESHTWFELAVLVVQQLVFFLVLWRAPLARISVRRLLIAVTTLALVPLYYWTITQQQMDPEPLLGGMRQFILMVVLMAALQRTAVTSARNLTFPFFSALPLPLERVDEADRRLVTAVEGGVFFALGLAMLALWDWLKVERINGIGGIDWSVDRPQVVVAWITFVLGYMLRVGAFGFVLMGHAHLLGVRVVAPIASPHRFTNVNEQWRGTSVYLYRFAYDAYYRQFFGSGGANEPAWRLVGGITLVFLAMAYLHFLWGPPQTSPTAIVLWTILGLAAGLTLLYLRWQARRRLAKFRALGKRPAPSRRRFVVIPVLVLLVLGFRGLLDSGVTDRRFLEHFRAFVTGSP